MLHATNYRCQEAAWERRKSPQHWGLVCEPIAVYTPRRPEESVLYRVVAGHMETFLARQRELGRLVPGFVDRELRSSLDCGILARGFMRCTATPVAWTGSCLTPANLAVSVRLAASGGWQTRQRTWWIAFSSKSRSGTGCCLSPFLCAIASRDILARPADTIGQQADTKLL